MLERVIPEEEVPLILKQYNKIAVKLIKQKEFERALEALSRSDEILDALQANGSEIENYFRLETIHNRSICFQRLGRLEDSAACILQSINLAKNRKNISKHYGVAEKIYVSRYTAKSRIRLCAIYSQTHHNEKALANAFKAVKKASYCLEQCLLACKEQKILDQKMLKSSRLRNRISKQPQYNLLESPHYKNSQSVVKQALPLLKSICEQFMSSKSKKKVKKPKCLFECEGME